ncbi:MAG: hypothetical protein AAFX58_13365 [Pseudomonadota bacterium]
MRRRVLFCGRYEAILETGAVGHLPGLCLAGFLAVAAAIGVAAHGGVALLGLLPVAVLRLTTVPRARQRRTTVPRRIVIDPNGAAAIGRHGRVPLALSGPHLKLPGLLVLGVGGEGASAVVAVAQRNRQSRGDWRRLTVLWRHRGAALVDGVGA